MKFFLALFAALPLHAATITRATAHLNGVTSPRGFFNITVRLYQIPGVEWAKYDLKKSLITLDFEPGSTTSSKQIQAAMSSAGYKPGDVLLEQVEPPTERPKRLGWNRIRRPHSRHAAVRWVELNFD